MAMNHQPPGEPEKGAPSHDFEAQKQGHQRIRNDPDYDDWTYGTEPLPQESWSATAPAESSPTDTNLSRNVTDGCSDDGPGG